MKKLILIAVAVLGFSAAANAQLYLGGTAWISANGAAQSSRISILPEIGYNINKHWAVGGAIGIVSNRVGTTTATNFQFAPYARYNWLQLGPVRLFADLQFTIAAGGGGTTWEIGAFPGIAFAATKHVTFLSRIGALSYNSGGTFSAGVDLTALAVGVYYAF